jgi:hypothetical protein
VNYRLIFKAGKYNTLSDQFYFQNQCLTASVYIYMKKSGFLTEQGVFW